MARATVVVVVAPVLGCHVIVHATGGDEVVAASVVATTLAHAAGSFVIGGHF